MCVGPKLTRRRSTGAPVPVPAPVPRELVMAMLLLLLLLRHVPRLTCPEAPGTVLAAVLAAVEEGAAAML